MSEKTGYAQLLRDPRWQRKRLEIYQRDNFTCRFCNDKDTELQVHHKRYERGKMPWEVADQYLVTLCDRCHERVTTLKRRANDLLGEMNIYELPIAVSMIERLVSGREEDRAQAAPAAAPPGVAIAPAAIPCPPPDMLTIEAWQAERNLIDTAGEFSREASRRLDVLDELTASAWDLIMGPATEAHGS